MRKSCILLLLLLGCDENPLVPQPEVGPIIFASNRDGKTQIYAMNDDGSNIISITQSDFNNYRPRWSRDGTSIVFNSKRSGNIHFEAIVMTDANGSNENVLLEHGLWPVFSPERSKIAFSYDTFLPGSGTPYDIVFYDLKMDEAAMFKRDSSSNDIINDWSPNDRHLLITKLINQQPDIDMQIFLLDTGTGVETRLTTGYFCNWGRFSPDGLAIVYTCVDSSKVGPDIFTINLDGSNKKNLTNTPNIPEYSPAWSQDGKRIVYIMGDGEGFSKYLVHNLFVINSDGTDKKRLTDDEFAISTLDWRWK